LGFGGNELIRDSTGDIVCKTSSKLPVFGIGTCLPWIIDSKVSDVKKRNLPAPEAYEEKA
jgi:hypothetical protein